MEGPEPVGDRPGPKHKARKKITPHTGSTIYKRVKEEGRTLDMDY